jgi:hypothetical protein
VRLKARVSRDAIMGINLGDDLAISTIEHRPTPIAADALTSANVERTWPEAGRDLLRDEEVVGSCPATRETILIWRSLVLARMRLSVHRRTLTAEVDMNEQGWRDFLAAHRGSDWVVLPGGATAVFRVRSVVEAARLAEALRGCPGSLAAAC